MEAQNIEKLETAIIRGEALFDWGYDCFLSNTLDVLREYRDALKSDHQGLELKRNYISQETIDKLTVPFPGYVQRVQEILNVINSIVLASDRTLP